MSIASGKARALRRNSTDAQQRLWSALRGRQLRGYKFRRQYPIGNFIVDFACTKYRLVIEAAGGQHAGAVEDALQADWLEAQGWHVLRLWNNEILSNAEGVVETILRVLRQS